MVEKCFLQFLQLHTSKFLSKSVCVHSSISKLIHHYTPRRAVLYVPGDDNRKLQKALSLKVDSIAMDCEDGVAANKKDAARSTIKKLLEFSNVSKSNPEWCVRINSVDSGFCEDDLKAFLTAKTPPPTILLPKVESPGHIQWFSDKVLEYTKDKNLQEKINLFMYIESARAVLDLPDICQKAEELSLTSNFKPVALVFGSDDLCASLGTARSEDAHEMLYARQRLVLVAKAFRLQAIDMVHIQFKDLEGLKKQSEAGARLGYTGKQVIHPSQVPVVQAAFLPSPESISWAKGLIKAFHEHQEKGKGAFVYKGSSIDMPLLLQAKNIVRLAEAGSSEN